MPNWHFLTARLQVVLGSVARDTVMWRNPLFYSTASGRPRDLFRFLPKGHFPEPEGWTSGPFPFLPQGHFRKRKDGPRGLTDLPQGHFRHSPRRTSGGAKRGWPVSHNLRTDLGGPQNVRPRLGTSRQTSGGPKSGLDVWDHLKTDLGGTFPQIGILSPLQTPFRISLCIGATG